MIRNVTNLDLAYAAGIIDGEGCIDYKSSFFGDTWHKKEYRTVRIRVVNTNKEVLLWLETIFGGQVYTRKTYNGCKPQWYWHTQERKRVIAILELIEPYLIIKRKQTRKVLDYETARQS